MKVTEACVGAHIEHRVKERVTGESDAETRVESRSREERRQRRIRRGWKALAMVESHGEREIS